MDTRWMRSIHDAADGVDWGGFGDVDGLNYKISKNFQNPLCNGRV